MAIIYPGPLTHYCLSRNNSSRRVARVDVNDPPVVFQQIDGSLRYLDAFSTDQDRRYFPSKAVCFHSIH